MCASRHGGRTMIKGIFKDFKEFAFKGNLVDMAVGIKTGRDEGLR